jgi:microcystin-dependent protein
MTFWKWSRTAASNANADSTCPFPEGMAPSAVNDGTRGMMAAAAKFRDDVSGAIVTTGTSTAYAVSSYQGFDTLPHLDGQMVAFTPHATNADTVTLNVDGLGAKPLRSSPGVELVAGTLILGTPYCALYNHTDGVFYLRGYHSSPFNVPFLGGLDYWDTVAPNSAFIFPLGQAISRTTYARAFARWGTTYGAGDGTTTFNVPDKSGRVSAMKEATASRLTSAVSGVDGAAMGSASGNQSHTLTLAQLPTGITSANAAQNIVVNSPNGQNFMTGAPSNFNSPGGGGSPFASNILANASTASGNNNITVTSNNTSGNAHPIVQPTIICNYIIRII